MPNTSLQSWLEQGPFTLALSSSFFGFYAHCAAVTVLYQRGFKPQKITGTSAGALVGGALASGMEPDDFRDLIFAKRFNDYWDPKLGPGIIAGQKFLKIMEDHFAPTFREAHIPLEVGALDIFNMKTVFLETGSLPQAVFASCAVPLMFHPVKIENRYYCDGGVFNKAGVNYEKSNERILNIYLDSCGLSGLYERKKNFTKLKNDHRVLRFPQIHKVNFRKLETGVDAYKDVYARTQKAFDQYFENGILNA